ncbi:hypothetical protein BD779DRAFT_1678959 [Infundibulicybe gibba]|nr:hypothetical protein BD779DRAFT_1678959 [Infundibulicybe gibba]
MFSTAFTLVASLSILGLTSASPVAPRTNLCRPNFQSLAVSAFGYYDDGTERIKEWYATPEEGSHVVLRTAGREALKTGEFILEFSGQPSNTHVIKQVANSQRDLKASVAGDGHFVFAKSSDGTQEFSIQCQECGQDRFIYANYCTITDPKTQLCVTGSSADSGEKLAMRKCDGSLGQQFGFIQALTDAQVSALVFE